MQPSQLRLLRRGQPRNLRNQSGPFHRQFHLHNQNEVASLRVFPLWRLGPHALCQLCPLRRYQTLFPSHNTNLHALMPTYLNPDVTNLYPALENHNFIGNSWPTGELPVEVQRQTQQLMLIAELHANTAPDEPAGKDAAYGNNLDHDAMPTSVKAENDDKGDKPLPEPSETNVWTLLEPLPPGWHHEHGQNRGLHPEDGACENSDEPMLRYCSRRTPRGEFPMTWTSTPRTLQCGRLTGGRSELLTRTTESSKGQWGRGPKTKLGGPTPRNMEEVHENSPLPRRRETRGSPLPRRRHTST